MEDRYLFKAKTTPKEKGEFNNVWVTGNLIVSNEKYYIHPVGNVVNVKNETGRIIVMHEVIPDTICQCTGLKDKNGKLIWENDIVKRNFYLYSSEAKYEEKENCGIVKYDKEYARFGYQCSVFAMLSESKKHDTIEVVGNIFDNPELLESEE